MTLDWLATDLRAAGLDVREIDGWQTRAVPGPFAPLGVLIHDTGVATLAGDALYEAVVARRLKLDAAAAHALMWRVHGSVENWEGDYVPKFVDVVKYMIVSEYVGQDTGVEGMSLDLGAFLAPRIDPHL